MGNRLTNVLSGAVLAAGLVVAGAGGASADGDCEAFTLTAGAKTTHILDNGDDGPSPGDVRVLERDLDDADGTPIGVVYMVSTLVKVGEGDVHTFAADFSFDLRDGSMSGRSLYHRPNDTSLYTDPITIHITGGAGYYDEVEGVVEVSSGEHPTYNFDIDCD